MYNRFRPGKEWLDTNGKPIQAHGFSVIYSEKDGCYYFTIPDRSPRLAVMLSGKLIQHSENTSIARYVWLPIEWE